MVRAKFRVEAVQDIGEASKSVTLRAVYSDDKESANYSWSKWTPSGELRMSITNPDAFNQFELGAEYFLDFTPVV